MRVASSYPAEVVRLLEGTDPAAVVEHGLWTRDVKGAVARFARPHRSRPR